MGLCRTFSIKRSSPSFLVIVTWGSSASSSKTSRARMRRRSLSCLVSELQPVSDEPQEIKTPLSQS